MHSQLELTPHGLVIAQRPVAASLEAFSDSESAGLFQIAGHKLPSDLDASVHFWKAFTESFIRAFCHLPETTSTTVNIPAPDPSTLAERILTAPPMRGAEYLSSDCLLAIWQRLNDWAAAQIARDGLAPFLAEHAPRWARVGRVTLHLAENKSDPEYPFAFMASYASGLTASGQVQQLPLGKALQEYAGAQDKGALLKLLSPLHAAAQQCDFLNELIETGDIFHPLVWLPEEAFRFLKNAPIYEDAGLLVRLPNWWKKRGKRPQVSATLGQKKRSSVGKDALLDFRLEVVIDGVPLSAAEIEQLLAGEDGLVLLSGQWIEVDRAKLQQALEHWQAVAAQGGLSLIEGMRLLAGAPADLSQEAESEGSQEWAFAQAGDWLQETLDQLRNPERTAPPETLQATLRPYQEKGLNWLWFCAQTGLGACLADDMGLGKTIQVLAALLRKQAELPDTPPSLLVVPASLIGNWQREAQKFAPSLRIGIAHRSSAASDAMRHSAEGLAEGAYDLIITTYGMLSRLDWLSKVAWHWVVLDEAQAIKNHSTHQSKAVRQLQAHARFALTGTPIENHLGDLWSLFDFLNPGLLGNANQFKRFAKSLASGDGENYAPLRRLVAPYILRRLKTDKSIISDLPDKTEMKVFCGLSTKQAKLYQQTAKTLETELKSTAGIQRKGLVLAYLMRFKQICNHPDQLTKTGDYTPKDSAKFTRLAELCSEIESRGEKVLIFTQFKEITDPLEACLAEVFGRNGLILHGGTPITERPSMVERFQREDGPPFFILSLKAGGTGLNLTAASHVIHFDRWWNPAIENQATDRAFRIGQRRHVLVHKFITTGTLEERIDKLISGKQNTANQILTSGSAEKAFTDMNNDELMDFVRLDLSQSTQS
ncbi:DEAD/DEAH box helicase [Coraliomargarita sp. SDUM461003]|uniref:DEAD/DEAH box helicase n=1 Tax=Thalassobacterium maritimum TaxID=3041265 RepID=A0ABU1AZ91_9BACT|nr:DEAD/DEAH box helicase [Coraliomargarita sp. SDUM461003]MDQ8208297.1 DEAD/DEAH box helicase [Coraliomargarita sp. SDUM461003]